MKKNTMRYVYLCTYEKDSVYEPAEGGYYVPIRRHVGTVRLGLKHAPRMMRQLKEFHEQYGELTGHSAYSVYTDDYEYHIERVAGSKEHLYHGYC